MIGNKEITRKITLEGENLVFTWDSKKELSKDETKGCTRNEMICQEFKKRNIEVIQNENGTFCARILLRKKLLVRKIIFATSYYNEKDELVFFYFSNEAIEAYGREVIQYFLDECNLEYEDILFDLEVDLDNYKIKNKSYYIGLGKLKAIIRNTVPDAELKPWSGIFERRMYINTNDNRDYGYYDLIEKRYIKGKNDIIAFAKAKREDWGI